MSEMNQIEKAIEHNPEYLRLKEDASTGLDGSPGNDTSKFAFDTINALAKRVQELERAIPSTYYSGRDIVTRVKFMVESWQKLVPLVEQLEKERDELKMLLAEKNITANTFMNQVKDLHQEQHTIRIACQREFDTPIAVDEDLLDLIGNIIDHHKEKEQQLSQLRAAYKEALEDVSAIRYRDLRDSHVAANCFVCEQLKKILTNPLAIEVMKEKKV